MTVDGGWRYREARSPARLVAAAAKHRAGCAVIGVGVRYEEILSSAFLRMRKPISHRRPRAQAPWGAPRYAICWTEGVGFRGAKGDHRPKSLVPCVSHWDAEGAGMSQRRRFGRPKRVFLCCRRLGDCCCCRLLCARLPSRRLVGVVAGADPAGLQLPGVGTSGSRPADGRGSDGSALPPPAGRFLETPLASG